MSDTPPPKNTLDDLADLFLTGDGAGDALDGPEPIRLPPKADRPTPQQVRQMLGEPPEPTLGDTKPPAGELDQLAAWLEAGGTPETDRPKPANPAEPDLPDLINDALGTAPAETEDPTDAPPAEPPAEPAEPMADVASPALRLAGGDDADPAAGPSAYEDDFETPPNGAALGGPIRGVAEAVVLGNLPGMAGPWLTQYGQLLAQQDGPTLILHVHDHSLDLELIEPTATQPHDSASTFDSRRQQGGSSLRLPPGGFAGRDLIDVLDQLGRSRVAPVSTVLVHLDPTPEALHRLLDLRDWTLISGADDAAIVAGYRLLKRLLDADARVAGRHVGLMIAGSDRTVSQRAAGKLRTAVANFLHAPLELLGYQQKMIPARSRPLGTFPDLDALWPRLITWLEELQPPTPAPGSPPGSTPGNAPAPSALKPRAAEPSPSEGDKAPDPTPDPAPAYSLPPLDHPVEVDPFGAAAADPLTSPSAEPDLFSLIDADPRTTASIPGGLPLEARCPSQPHTQLALDATGRLHLLHRHDSAEGDPPTPREAIVELVAVRNWARQHRQLLQLTERGRRFDPDADPVLHLFTDRADLSVQLVARLGDLLKLHLLRDVAVGDQHTFFCTPLSA
jgi:hypothetical protein